MKYIVAYHNDLDGVACASVLAKKLDFPNCAVVDGDKNTSYSMIINNNNDCYYFVPVNYNSFDRFNMLEFELEPNSFGVYLFDFTFSVAKMHHLVDSVSSFTWVDHHESVKENAEYEEVFKKIDSKSDSFKYVFDCSRFGASELCWNLIFPDTNILNRINMAAKYDVFKFTEDERMFAYGLNFNYSKLHSSVLSEKIRYLLLEEDVPNDILRGEVIDGVIENVVSSYSYQRARQFIILGEDVIVPLFQSGFNMTYNNFAANKIIEKLNPSDFGYDNIEKISTICFYNDSIDKNRIILSFRSNDGKSAKMCAEKFSGGGHPNAAGGSVSREDFPLIITTYGKPRA